MTQTEKGRAGLEGILAALMTQTGKDRARLEAILAALAGGMMLANRGNRAFREKAAEGNGVAEIRTEDRSVVRQFSLSHGLIGSRRGSHPDPDFAIVYQDAGTAVRVMLQGSQAAAMQAISEGKMRVEGDMVFGMWFSERLQEVGALMKNPRDLVRG